MFYAQKEYDYCPVCIATVLTPEIKNNGSLLPIHFSLDANTGSKPRYRKIDLKIK